MKPFVFGMLVCLSLSVTVHAQIVDPAAKSVRRESAVKMPAAKANVETSASKKSIPDMPAVAIDRPTPITHTVPLVATYPQGSVGPAKPNKVKTASTAVAQSTFLAPQLKHDGTPIIARSSLVAPTRSALPAPGVTAQADHALASYAQPVHPAISKPEPKLQLVQATEDIPISIPDQPNAASSVLPPIDVLEPQVESADNGATSDWSQFTKWAEPEQVESTFRTVGLLTIISLAPAILLMTTSFVRISVVLGLLRQAIGTQMLPSNQIVTSLAMFLTALVMMPTWQQVYDQAVVPYTDQTSPMTAEEAWDIGVKPVRIFMSNQIEFANNSEDVLLFYSYLPNHSQPPATYEDVPLRVLLPAFMISELKIAFLIGFQIYLPFLIVDLVVSSVTVSMGMMMLPPVTVSLPLKLLLFVLVDGWHLVVGMLLQSFGGFS